MTAKYTLRIGDSGPPMVGLVPRSRPVVKALRYDPVRLAMIHSMDRQRVIEAIAGQLFVMQTGNTLQQMYVGESPLRRGKH